MQVLISFKCEGFKHVKMVLDLHFEQIWLWCEYQIAGDGGDWRDSGNFDLDGNGGWRDSMMIREKGILVVVW